MLIRTIKYIATTILNDIHYIAIWLLIILLLLIALIEVNPPVQAVAEGEDVTFECTVIRQTSSLFVVWWLNNAYEVLNSIQSDVQSKKVTLQLSLRNVTNEDYQIYTCSGIDYAHNYIFVTASVMLSKYIYSYMMNSITFI